MQSSIDLLMEQLKEGNDHARWSAARGLNTVGEVTQALIEASANDENGSVRWWAVRSLGEIFRKTDAVVQNLMKALNDPNLGVRGQAASEAVPALLEALADPTRKVRGRATVALSRIGTPQDAVVRG
jgi:HEAT repeat protein